MNIERIYPELRAAFKRAPGGFPGFEGVVRKAGAGQDYYAPFNAFLRGTLELE